VILIAIIAVIGLIFIVMVLKRREAYILLDEVIPEGRIVSHEEGIIEYRDIRYVVGTHDLMRRKHLIEHLRLLDLEGPATVDVRFEAQVIIKQGAGFGAQKSVPHSAQSRRN
jgi:hypothetical protein